jgi:Nif-specific regulatory protein
LIRLAVFWDWNDLRSDRRFQDLLLLSLVSPGPMDENPSMRDNRTIAFIMAPRLVALSGPLKGTSWELDSEELTVGRDPANHVMLNDGLVSRRHCIIRKVGDYFKIIDLDSLNGTFVDYLPIKERTLEHANRIEVGDSHFVFLTHEEESDSFLTTVQLDPRDLASRSTFRLRASESIYFKPELPADHSVAQDLKTLLYVSHELGSLCSTQMLWSHLMELILEAFPAERGAILIQDESTSELVPVLSRNKLTPAETIQVSAPVLQQSLRERTALLSNDLPNLDDPSLPYQPSSLLCAPLVLSEKAIGAIYLDTSDKAIPLRENHLQLLTAMANMAALAYQNARHVEWLESENRRLNAEMNIEHNMIGESAAMQTVYSFIAKVASTDSTILVHGESGTGKEMVARAVHRNSPRVLKPFVAINCAALSETLLESELFGHERGAFTGAVAQVKGKLEVADTGTLFLDEVAELSPSIQAKLLRFLQEREFERIGGRKSIKVDVRLIAATNKDLKEAVKEGKFREDLFYRLNVVSIQLPPLRERKEDIPLLANYFTVKYGDKFKRRVSGISQEARAYLMQYDWPGNVRELENAMERAVVLGNTETILPEDLPESILEAQVPAGSITAKYHEAVSQAKKKIIQQAFDQAAGDLNKAADMLGLHPVSLYRLLRNLNLKGLLNNSPD